MQELPAAALAQYHAVTFAQMAGKEPTAPAARVVSKVGRREFDVGQKASSARGIETTRPATAELPLESQEVMGAKL